MPWAQSYIDLGFPEIKKVQLDSESRPRMEKVYPFSYLRRGSEMGAIFKDEEKVQN